MHKSILKALGYNKNTSDKELIKDWKKRTKEICKPCWELQYCPYGPIVEDFPLISVTRDESIEHIEYLKICRKTGKLGSGEDIDNTRRKLFEEWIASFNPNDYPEKIPTILEEAACRFFGHLCPVFFVAEPYTETIKRRKHSRSISRETMLKVVRRDGQVCQKCNETVPDQEVEFDHIIPYSKGGRSVVDNLRLVHRDCNRRKSDSLNEILHPWPIQHLFDDKNKRRKKLISNKK
jgi:hypothetical protein